MKIKKALKIIKQWEIDNPVLQLCLHVKTPEYKRAKKTLKKFVNNLR